MAAPSINSQRDHLLRSASRRSTPNEAGETVVEESSERRPKQVKLVNSE